MSEGPVTSQPRSQQIQIDVPQIDFNHLMQGNWRKGCLECLDDPPMCLFGYCCPCLLAWKNAEALGENPLLHCVGTFFFPIVTLQRYRTRQKFGIDVSINTFFEKKM